MSVVEEGLALPETATGFSRIMRIFGVKTKGGLQGKKSKKASSLKPIKRKKLPLIEEDGWSAIEGEDPKKRTSRSLIRKVSFRKMKFVTARRGSAEDANADKLNVSLEEEETLAEDVDSEELKDLENLSEKPEFSQFPEHSSGVTSPVAEGCGGGGSVSQLEASVDREPTVAVKSLSHAEVISKLRSAWMSTMDVSSDSTSISENYITPTDSPVSPRFSSQEEATQNLGVPNATAAQNQVGDKREHLYKILVIGELGTGKTSIIKRYVHQFFSQHYRATIGVDFALKVLNWDANTIIRLQLWDIAGQERFGNMTRVYYKEAVGAFIVFDVTRAATFDAVLKWKQDLDSKVQLADGSPIPCVLLANKCDQQKEGIVNQPAKMDEYCKERGFSGWFETSAKENINIEEAAKALVTKILQNDQVRIQSDSVKDGEKFNLDGNNLPDDKTKPKCSC